ncbi:predicted protein [Streptomyces sp. AA4]|nr:predicted protein [Streptomyces sp. AA4]
MKKTVAGIAVAAAAASASLGPCATSSPATTGCLEFALKQSDVSIQKIFKGGLPAIVPSER